MTPSDVAESGGAGRKVVRERGRARTIGWLIAHVLWRTEVAGAERVPVSGPVILAANHTGVLDGPVMFGASPRLAALLIKQGAFVGPLGWFLTWARQIRVDLSSPRASLSASMDALGEGRVVGIFPEGHRGRGDASQLRGGVAWLALNAGVPVVPVAILGTRRTGESTGHVPGLRRRLAVEFGEPIVVVREPGVSGKLALDAASQQIADALTVVVSIAVARTGLTLPDDDPATASA